MTTESENKSESVHAGPQDCGCGPGGEQAAIAEIEHAKANLAEAGQEIKKGLHDMDEAQRELAKAEHDLEEARHNHVIHITVDGEPFETKQVDWTPNVIIKEIGQRDPSTNYLVEVDGRHKVSFQGKGDIPIKLHDCERFQIISTGPTPVSDGSVRTGAEYFVTGLKALGYKPTSLPGKPDYIVIDYKVESGKCADKPVRLGFIVPADFPLTPPGGPQVSPHIHPIHPDGEHPTGRVHASAEFQSLAGGEWQYWSRPFKDWGQTRKTVASYMSHVWRLWDSQ